jgi:hypothetical protein
MNLTIIQCKLLNYNFKTNGRINKKAKIGNMLYKMANFIVKTRGGNLKL